MVAPIDDRALMTHPWVQLRDLHRARVLLILPCNAAACVGNYFRAEVYSKNGWNTWREADYRLQDLRREGQVAFAAFDSSILETQPHDPRGALVLETEMSRAANADGEDWGAPSWRWFRPTLGGSWKKMEQLTEAAVRGVHRVREMGFDHVFALVNPRAYFLALAAAAERCGLLSKWVLFRTPPHPRFLIPALGEVIPIVRAAVHGAKHTGGIYIIPSMYPALRAYEAAYGDPLPHPWRECNQLSSHRKVTQRWRLLQRCDAPLSSERSSLRLRSCGLSESPETLQ